jgi:uncharacterized protein (TIGR02246 family)
VTRRELLDGLFAAWRDGDALRSAAHFAIDGAYREAGHEPIVGRDAIVAHFTRFFRDGPRFAFEVDETIVEGERAAVRYRFSIAGPGERWMEKAGCAFVAFSDGTIREWREYHG